MKTTIKAFQQEALGEMRRSVGRHAADFAMEFEEGPVVHVRHGREIGAPSAWRESERLIRIAALAVKTSAGLVDLDLAPDGAALEAAFWIAMSLRTSPRYVLDREAVEAARDPSVFERTLRHFHSGMMLTPGMSAVLQIEAREGGRILQIVATRTTRDPDGLNIQKYALEPGRRRRRLAIDPIGITIRSKTGSIETPRRRADGPALDGKRRFTIERHRFVGIPDPLNALGDPVLRQMSNPKASWTDSS